MKKAILPPFSFLPLLPSSFFSSEGMFWGLPFSTYALRGKGFKAMADFCVRWYWLVAWNAYQGGGRGSKIPKILRTYLMEAPLYEVRTGREKGATKGGWGKAVIMPTREEVWGSKYLKCLQTSYVHRPPPFSPLFCLGLYAIRIAAGKRVVVQPPFIPLLAEWTVQVGNNFTCSQQYEIQTYLHEILAMDAEKRTASAGAVQGWENFFVHGLVKLVPAVAYQFCLN